MKNRMKYKITRMFVVLSFLSAMIIPKASAQTSPQLKSQGAMVVESVNGQVLYSHQVEEMVEVGGLSKVLLLYIAAQAIQQGEVKETDKVIISDQAYALSQDYNLQNVPLRQDFEYEVQELMEAIVITGANGATLALAEHIAGSEKNAVKMMEEALEEWGYSSKIYNVTGLPTNLIAHDKSTYEKGNVNKMSAAACATASYHLIQEYPQILEDAQQSKAILKEESDDPYEMSNAVAMIEGNDYAYEGTTGLMLGTSEKSGDSAIITAQRSGIPVISVILGTQKRGEGQRYHESKKLLDYTFSMYVMKDIVKKHQKVTEIGQVGVRDGVSQNIDLAYSESYQMAMPIVESQPRVTYTFVANERMVNDQGAVQAPIKKATQVGYVQLNMDQKKTTYLPGAKGNRVGVQTSETVAEAPWYQKSWNNMTQAVNDSWEKTRVFFTNLFN